MKRVLTLLFCCAIAGLAHSQQMDQEAMMKAWQAYMTPGDVHKMLGKSDGKWTTETTMWMDPMAPPAKSKGTCVNKMTLGGRYQESDFHGSFMGQPFDGRGTLAYDNAKKVFINTWIDNMGTGIMVLQGPWDEASKSITFTGNVVDPSSGKDTPVREIFSIRDDNHHHMEMYMNGPDGKEMKTMEIDFTRAGK